MLAACVAAAATTADPGNIEGHVVHVHRRYPHTGRLARPDVDVEHPHTRLYHPKSCDGGERLPPANPTYRAVR